MAITDDMNDNFKTFLKGKSKNKSFTGFQMISIEISWSKLVAERLK